MTYGIIATERKVFSEVVTALGGFESVNGVEVYTGVVTVKGTAKVEPIGVPVIWIKADSAYVPFTTQNPVDAASADAPNNATVAILVGDERGVGFNTFDVQLTSTGVKATALIKGEAAIKQSGISFPATSLAANKTAFLTALAKQGITSVKEAIVVDPTYL